MEWLPDLSPRQQRAAAAISLGAIATVVAALLWVGSVIVTGTLSGDRPPGIGLMLLMENSTILVAGKSIPLILGVGAAALARSTLRDGIFYAIVGLCVAGVILSLTYLVLLSAPSIAGEMFNNAPTDTLATSQLYNAALVRFFVPLTVWLIGMLAIQLGIKVAAPASPPPPMTTPIPASPGNTA